MKKIILISSPISPLKKGSGVHSSLLNEAEAISKYSDYSVEIWGLTGSLSYGYSFKEFDGYSTYQEKQFKIIPDGSNPSIYEPRYPFWSNSYNPSLEQFIEAENNYDLKDKKEIAFHHMMEEVVNVQDNDNEVVFVNYGHEYQAYQAAYQNKVNLILRPNLSPMNHFNVIDLFIPQLHALSKPMAFISSTQAHYFLGTQKEKNNSAVLYQCFEEHLFPERTPAFEERKIDLFWAAGIDELKGLHVACEVALRLNKQIHVAGPILNQHYFNTVMEKYSNIVYVGNLNQEELYSYYQNSKVFLQTQKSVMNEAFGRTVAEAGMLGCYLGMLDVGANYEAGGFFFPVFSNKEALVKHLVDIFETGFDNTNIATELKNKFSQKMFAKTLLSIIDNKNNLNSNPHFTI